MRTEFGGVGDKKNVYISQLIYNILNRLFTDVLFWENEIFKGFPGLSDI